MSPAKPADTSVLMPSMPRLMISGTSVSYDNAYPEAPDQEGGDFAIFAEMIPSSSNSPILGRTL
jgi:hypothetical protein